MNIIFLGAPGSGKGTQAAILSKLINIPAISTGEILRDEVSCKSKIGNLAKSFMDSGKLVPDHLVIDIVKARLIKPDCKNGFILDGFPRNISQAIELENMLGSIQKKIEIVFNFDVPEEILVKRISGRFLCGSCGAVYNKFFKMPKQNGVCDICDSNYFESRDDDNELVVKSRLDVYHKSNFELIKFYKKKNLLVLIDAVKGATLISEDLIKIVSKLIRS